MNTIHRPPLDSAQRIYERRLRCRQAMIATLASKCARGDSTPWDLPQECPRDTLNAPQTHFDGENDSGQHPQDQNASEGQWYGHTYQQIAFSALVLLGAGLLCLLAGVALGAWIALERFRL